MEEKLPDPEDFLPRLAQWTKRTANEKRGFAFRRAQEKMCNVGQVFFEWLCEDPTRIELQWHGSLKNPKGCRQCREAFVDYIYFVTVAPGPTSRVQ